MFGNGTLEGPSVSHSRQTSRAGFTLIEILMVIVLIALVAAFGIPKLNFSGYRINGAVRSVSALIQRAQRLAITDQNNINVLFDVANNQIKIHSDANNDNVVQASEKVSVYPVGEGVVFGRNGAPVRLYSTAAVSFSRTQNGLPEIIFRRDGSASENGGLYITTTTALNSSRPQDARSIEVTRATGRVEWYQYNGSSWIKKF
jgi:prepilin-type N-terminal cleavage/methylation domain-containing protein